MSDVDKHKPYWSLVILTTNEPPNKDFKIESNSLDELRPEAIGRGTSEISFTRYGNEEDGYFEVRDDTIIGRFLEKHAAEPVPPPEEKESLSYQPPAPDEDPDE